MALPVDEDPLPSRCSAWSLRRRAASSDSDEIERTAHAMLAENRDYQLLRMIPGIGPIALTILAEAGDLRRFAHHRQFLKFCGSICHVRHIPRANQASKYGNARTTPHLLDGDPGCHPSATTASATSLAAMWPVMAMILIAARR
jgi:hypothetical protein